MTIAVYTRTTSTSTSTPIPTATATAATTVTAAGTAPPLFVEAPPAAMATNAAPLENSNVPLDRPVSAGAA